MGILESLFRLLCCPDDHGALMLYPDRMECLNCGRDFQRQENFASLVSRDPATVTGSTFYAQRYLALRREMGPGTALCRGWRIPASTAPRSMKYKRRQVASVGMLLAEGLPERELVCDFSAGPGYYTFTYARSWRYVIHCDLSVDSFVAPHRHALRDGVDNILFVRMDYLRPPFRFSLPRILCMDSLVRGEDHETALLQAILGSLTPDGTAVIDFHNWWHNPLRRLGLLPDNFIHNRSYGRRELPALLGRAGITRYECFPFHQEASPGSPFASLVAQMLPPTRWMYRFSHGAEPHSGSA